MTYRIGKRYTFDAAHQLDGHHGKCANLHGHTYTVEVIIEYINLLSGGSSDGMVFDYGDLDAVVKPVIEKMDHAFLTNCREPAWFSLPEDSKTCRVGVRTTAENLARWIHDQVNPSLPGMVTVRVSETPRTFAEYDGVDYGPSPLSRVTWTDEEIKDFRVKWDMVRRNDTTLPLLKE